MQQTRAELGRIFLDETRVRLEESVQLIHHCVGQLDDEQIWWRPRAEMNSIGNLLLHLAGNLRQRLQSDIGGEPDERDRLAEFTERGQSSKAELLARFDASASEALARLHSLDPDSLGETRIARTLAGESEKSVLAIALQALTHLSGHAQEILSMTRMQRGGNYRFRSPEGVPPDMRPRG